MPRRRVGRFLRTLPIHACVGAGVRVLFALLFAYFAANQRPRAQLKTFRPALQWPCAVPPDWPASPPNGDRATAAITHWMELGQYEVQLWGTDGQQTFQCICRTYGFPFPALERVSRWKAPASGWSTPAAAAATDDQSWAAGVQVTWPHSVMLPIMPWWPGFLADTLLWGAVSFAIGSFASYRRKYRRLMKALCPRCKYPIGTVPTCAECGEPIPGGLARVAPASTPIANEPRA